MSTQDVYIKYLPKDKLLFALWKNARLAQYFYYCHIKPDTITLETCKKDICNMIGNGRGVDVTTYQGRLIFANITGDYLDTFNYNVYNGEGKAESIITELKKEELLLSITTFYKF